MFSALIKLLQYFKKLKQGGCLSPPSDMSREAKPPSGLMFLKYCKNIICAQSMFIYFRLHCLYIEQVV